MKESVTKFDLEAAFKALDEIEIPAAEKGIKANKPALTEIFSRKSKLDVLIEEYYDIGNNEELSDAKEAREAEVAKAKLARIEKIVDLDAESPEDLLTTYVGKFIIQCPQCMTLFYKNPEDVEESEEDPTTVNVNEVCQHCGNESGYTLIGKVGEATPEETAEINDELDVDITSTEEMEEASEELEEPATDEADDAFDLDVDLDAGLDELDLDSEEDTDKKEESFFITKDDQILMEDVDLEVSSEEFEKLIKSPEFQKPITDADTRAMIDTLTDENAEDLQEDTDPEKSISNEKEANSDKDQKNDEVASDLLTEGIFDKFKEKVSGAVDKITSGLKSREAKADWILKNALEENTPVKINNGKLEPDEENQRFQIFLIIGFKDRYSSGKLITMPPSFNNKDLVADESGPRSTREYKKADNFAKGWSSKQGNGPAFIYLAKDTTDKNAVFLCEYFKGKLEKDQVDKYFKVIKDDLKARKLMAKSEVASEEETTNEVTTPNSDTSAEETVESLSGIMDNLEELQESYLEEIISNSLIESYGNVAGFRLKNCTYLNEKLNINGTIHFTSGNTRETTYSFKEAYVTDKGQIKLQGFNEKLGLDKVFTILGHIEKSNKTFITESFQYTKNK